MSLLAGLFLIRARRTFNSLGVTYKIDPQKITESPKKEKNMSLLSIKSAGILLAVLCLSAPAFAEEPTADAAKPAEAKPNPSYRGRLFPVRSTLSTSTSSRPFFPSMVNFTPTSGDSRASNTLVCVRTLILRSSKAFL